MSGRSSEEVLLIVNHVKNKKTEGNLYMMGERVGWMQGSKSNFTYSYLYSDIKAQKISPDTKEKVQLQLNMHDGSANTFHFNNPKGREAAVKDRDTVKELLLQLLPKFKRKLNSELEEKNRLLQDNPEIFQLYKDLVVSGVMSSDEFWAQRAEMQSKSTSTKSEGKQVVGVSAAFLADIKPETDGCNGLKYNLTTDIIESIFRTYPMVKKKHLEYVPHQLSESEFWTRFFQSHYFHRDRTNISKAEMFSDCAKNDEKEISDEIEKNVSDPLIDLVAGADVSQGEGYGGSSSDQKSFSTNHANLTMIRRFNHHSTMVLKACDINSESTKSLGSSGTSNSTLTNGNSNNSNGAHSSKDSCEPVTKKAKMQEKINYSDLKDTSETSSVNLRLHKMEGYLHGPTPVMTTKYTTSEDVIAATQNVTQEMHNWVLTLSQVVSSGTAVSVLGELSPGGSLMHGTSQQQLQHMVPEEMQEELKTQYNALLELLRHFWACFPVQSKSLEEKVVRMKSTLEKFQMAKLQPLKESIQQYHYALNLTGHMEELLSAAFSKFDNWQMRKMSKKS
ncbi:general transcription factor IIH subunit 1-like [Mytilus edulis]|uniref:general transcription factor IIH subunit 1-like n=1 Tax=Mytilus edulis TaxID=6550 RepID=UPI0039EF3161